MINNMAQHGPWRRHHDLAAAEKVLRSHQSLWRKRGKQLVEIPIGPVEHFCRGVWRWNFGFGWKTLIGIVDQTAHPGVGDGRDVVDGETDRWPTSDRLGHILRRREFPARVEHRAVRAAVEGI